MARKQSSKIYFQGKYHNEIYFQGHYHDKMYIGNQLVWEKLSETEAGRLDVFKGNIARWKGKLYAVCKIIKLEGYKQVTVANNALVEYNLEKERWIMLSGDLGEITGKYVYACDNGVACFYHSESGYGTDFRSTKFIDFSGNLYNCPTEDIEFLSNTPYGSEIVTVTNRGVLNNNGNLYEYYYTHGDGKSLIIEGSSRIERGSVYNGNVYGYRRSAEVPMRTDAIKATITDSSINVTVLFSFTPEVKDGYYVPGSERIIDCWSDGYGAIITTEEYGDSNKIVKRNYYDATTGGLLFSYDYWTTGALRRIALLAMGKNKEVAVMEVTGYATKINIHKNGEIVDSIQVADGFYTSISDSKYTEQFFIHYNEEEDKNEVYFGTVKITDGMTASEAIQNQETRVVR